MPFYIEQVAGKRRRIELEGRAMPFPGGVRWGGEQRLETTWLPGSPDGVTQIFGPKEKPMSLQGRWSSNFMVGDSPECSVRVDGANIGSAVEAARLLDLVRQEGIMLRVAYQEEVRYGFLKEFDYGPWEQGRTMERIDWSASFEWTSRSDNPSAPAIPSRAGVPALASRLAILVQQIDASNDKLSGTADALISQVAAPVEQFRNLALSATNTARSWVQKAQSAAAVAQGTLGIVTELQQNAVELREAVQSVVPGRVAQLQTATFDATLNTTVSLATEPFEIGGRALGGFVPGASLDSTLRAAKAARELQVKAEEVSTLADAARLALSEAIQKADPRIAYAMRGEDLRDLARRILGSSDSARDLLVFNGLSTYALTAGQAILIPASNTPAYS